jgi:NAD+ synthase
MQTEKVVEHIVKWLKDYQASSHTKGFIVGVSGGVDSAVVSTLCARTGLPVLVLEMPIRQSANEVGRSHAHINWLKTNFPNVTGGEVNLTEIFETFEKTVKQNELNETNSSTEIAFANVRSRLRMVKIDSFNSEFIKIFLFFFQRLIYIILLQLKIILLVGQEIKSKILV